MNGASRARTGDLLGAIQNPEIPARSVISMDSSIFQAVWRRPALSHTAFPPIAVHVRVANGLQALLPPRATDEVRGPRSEDVPAVSRILGPSAYSPDSFGSSMTRAAGVKRGLVLAVRVLGWLRVVVRVG